MHGIGNDYIYVNGFVEKVADPVKVAQVVSDRHFGIGGDGLILILPSEKADVRMRMFNADGSESEMCGNGVRCVAKYAYDHGLSKSNPMNVETGRGVLSIALEVVEGKVRQATVNMGRPILEAERRFRWNSDSRQTNWSRICRLLSRDPSSIFRGRSRNSTTPINGMATLRASSRLLPRRQPETTSPNRRHQQPM